MSCAPCASNGPKVPSTTSTRRCLPVSRPGSDRAWQCTTIRRLDTLTRVLGRGSHSNELFRLGLLAFAIPFFLYSDLIHLVGYPVGVDLEIPLQAAERWTQGGQPYLESAFATAGGATSPFLYPPYVLPVLALFTALPRTLVIGIWLAICAGSLALLLRRLGLAVRLWPIVAILAARARGTDRR